MKRGAKPDAIALSAGDPVRGDRITGEVVLKVGGEPLAFAITLPAGPSTAQQLLPIMQGLGDVFAARGIAAIERAGKALSCRAGCAACCRQMVPIAQAEATALSDLVESMPEPRRSAIRARFDAALEAVEAADILDRICAGGPGTTRENGVAYLRLGIACPFLEDETCSIYRARPLACREYLVTSPAEHCADPTPETIAMVPVQGHPSRALLNAEPEHGWTALILALCVAARSSPPVPNRTGPDILRGFVQALRD